MFRKVADPLGTPKKWNRGGRGVCFVLIFFFFFFFWNALVGLHWPFGLVCCGGSFSFPQNLSSVFVWQSSCIWSYLHCEIMDNAHDHSLLFEGKILPLLWM